MRAFQASNIYQYAPSVLLTIPRKENITKIVFLMTLEDYRKHENLVKPNCQEGMSIPGKLRASLPLRGICLFWALAENPGLAKIKDNLWEKEKVAKLLAVTQSHTTGVFRGFKHILAFLRRCQVNFSWKVKELCRNFRETVGLLQSQGLQETGTQSGRAWKQGNLR